MVKNCKVKLKIFVLDGLPNLSLPNSTSFYLKECIGTFYLVKSIIVFIGGGVFFS